MNNKIIETTSVSEVPKDQIAPYRITVDRVLNQVSIKQTDPSQSAFTIRLYNINGQVVRIEPPVTSSNHVFHVGNLPTGVYILSIEGKTQYSRTILF